ncbi:hypothetical protein [uncultured Chitinophaga sp.]|uniref:hypothetical protein n=1 Tax=uncultured Chitinophaga sp. TaxID=339340 RepID=UPI0025E316AF|nr:hypothetical protein [uncultured Chitinophaga sp.]
MRSIIVLFFTCFAFTVQAQELYVSAEPASNMPANSLGLRLTNKFFKMEHENRTGFRFEPEVMFGINRNLMLHFTGYMANAMQENVRFEGGSVYAKYRFFSQDEPHSHFRMAAYVKGSVIDNPFEPKVDPEHSDETVYANRELDLEGMASGVSGGIIATKLVHKLAVSGTLGYNRFLNNIKTNLPDGFSENMLNYSLSFGYLTLPITYKSYEQTNMNLYVEFLGKANMDQGRGNYIDVAPAIQFIFNSTTRLDLAYRWEVSGNMVRNMPNSFTVRMEHNIFNAFKRK